MRFYTLLADEKPVGRMLLDDDGTGYAVLDCLQKPLAVVEKTPGEPWAHRCNNRKHPERGHPLTHGGVSFKNFTTPGGQGFPTGGGLVSP
jgi:hypothetical protein